jgi:hypothetical protein
MSERLDHDLQATAAGFDIPSGDVDTVVDRARQRTHRRKRVQATASTIAVVVALVSGVMVFDTNDKATPVATVGHAAQRGDIGLRWHKVDPSSVLGMAADAGGTGPLYALSTGAGEKPTERTRMNGVVWRSDDGIEWQAASRLGSDLYLSDLASGADRLYAVGTGPATTSIAGRKPFNDAYAGWSDDGGKSFAKARLPIDTAAIAAHATSSGVGLARIATGARGTVAIVSMSTEPDVASLLPAGATAPNGWAVSDAGIDVLGPRPDDDGCPAGSTTKELMARAQGDVSVPDSTVPGRIPPTFCFKSEREAPIQVTPQDARGVTRSYSWAELGVSGDVVSAFRSEAMTFVAPPGSTAFERVDPPADNVGFTPYLLGDDDGFTLITQKTSYSPDQSPFEVLRSADGRTWTPAGSVPGWVQSAGRLGSTDAVVASEQTADGGSVPRLYRSTEGNEWAPTDLSTLVDTPADSDGGVWASDIGPFGVAAVFSVMPRQERLRAQPTFYILSSRDGITWQVDALEGLAGMKIGGVPRVLVTRDSIVINAIKAGTDTTGTQPAEKITLVGTA